MYDDEQEVPMKWNNNNVEWFTSRGYDYTKRYDVFMVKAKDLPPTSKIKIKVVCDYCGKDYETEYALLCQGRVHSQKDACAQCAAKKASEVSLSKRAHKNFVKLEEVCKENGYTLVTKENEFTDVKMNIEFVCPKHGMQVMMLDNFKRGHKCIECSYEARASGLRYNVGDVVGIVSEIDGNEILNPDEYKDVFENNLMIKCACGNVYKTSLSKYKWKGITRCPKCASSESSGELSVRKFLEAHNISFKQWHRFEDCRDVKTLPFDFYLPEANVCIEFDGQYHYKDVYNDGGLETTQRHDKMKDDYCVKNNIKMIRIPYYLGNHVDDILSNELGI